MRPLVHDLIVLTQRNKDGSFATQHNRHNMLKLFGEQLIAMGYKEMRAGDFSRRHRDKLLAHWRKEGVSIGTLKNRCAVLRWWAEKIGRASVMPEENEVLGLEKRSYIAHTSKAKDLPQDKLRRVDDPYVQLSLELQDAFGLRLEECIKIRVWQADEGHQLRLQASWCKGGLERVIPIETAAQRAVLDRAKALMPTKQSALIPPDKTYRQQMHRYTYRVSRAGLSKLHGLRHFHFQRRYEELTGFACPVQGGPRWAAMTPAQKLADQDARAIIAEEMGHGRIAITRAYLG